MTRNEKYEKVRQLLLKYIEKDYGKPCKTKDTVDFPDILTNPKHNRCPVCLIYDIVDELFAELDLDDPDDV